VHNYDLAWLSESKLAAEEGSLLMDIEVPEGGYVALRKMGE
jgi:hypothetical protein